MLIAGRVTLSRDVQRLLARPEVDVQVISPLTTWADASHVVRRVHTWSDLQRSHDAVSNCVDRAWASAWRKAGAALSRRITPLIEQSWPSGLAVASTVAHESPAHGLLFVGSSKVVRDLDLARNPARVPAGVTSMANRGLAGIDGVVSSAIGAALAAGTPAVALVGDLTFLHDLNSLLIGPDEPRPDLTVVVLNDDGGGIFATLEPGRPELSDSFERVFATPTGADLSSLCAGYHVPYERITEREKLIARIAAPPKGISVVEVPTDRSDQRALRSRLRQESAAALAELD